ncbi:MAG: hypothetical protein IJY04_04860 [Clostridia bacterium]|nr:hypothetical protein [Clostridia bacterium]
MESHDFDFSIKNIERLSTGVMKKAFSSFRQILIALLYVVAIFFVLNDFSFALTSAEDMAVSKLPWLVLYVLAHYFCRDYGVQMGREDVDYRSVDEKYRRLCDRVRGERRRFEDFCLRLSQRYEDVRKAELYERLGISLNDEGEPIVSELDKRTARALKRGLSRRQVKVSYRLVVDNSRESASRYRPIKPSFESYMRRTSVFSILKIVFLSCFTFSLTATLGADPLGSLISGIPYLVTMISVSMTAALGAYRSVLTYEIDCLNDKIAILDSYFAEA